MKRGLVIIALVAAGCAHGQRGERRWADRVSALDELAQPVSASALVFDPPVAYGGPELGLSRQGRALEAFWGFDGGITTSYYLRTDDRQFDNSLDGVRRRAISQRFGVSFR